MSLKTRKLSALTLKVIAVGLFVFMAVMNVQLINGNATNGLDLNSISLEVNKMSVQAESPGQQCVDRCGWVGDCCNACYTNNRWIIYYDYQEGGCGSCPNWC